MIIVPVAMRVRPQPAQCQLCGNTQPKLAELGPPERFVLGCFKCLRACLVELAEETGHPLKITTVIHGTEQTTNVNIRPDEDEESDR